MKATMTGEVVSVDGSTTASASANAASRPRTYDGEFAAYLAARQGSLLRTAYLLTGSQHGAEDLVQDTMAKLYLSWDRVARADSVDAYVRRTMINEHNSLWRRAWKRKEVLTDVIPDRTAAADTASATSNPALWAFIQTLPRKQRAVVVLRYYEELSEAETADILGISIGTVKSQTSRALAGLRSRAPQSLNPHPLNPNQQTLNPEIGEDR